MPNTKKALGWIVTILKKHKVPYRLAGGFAARMYGSKRKLADIDIDTTDKGLDKILPDVEKYIVKGPKRYKDKNWDVLALELKYKGQEIGIIGTNSSKIFDKRTQKWVRYKADFAKVKRKKVYGMIANFISKEELITYKQKLQRRVDISDFRELLSNTTRKS